MTGPEQAQDVPADRSSRGDNQIVGFVLVLARLGPLFMLAPDLLVADDPGPA